MKKFYSIMMVAAVVFAACDSKEGDPVDETVTYAGVTYKTVTLTDGSTWMAEPLRYVPEGKTVSDNPADGNGVWYPYSVKDKVASVLKDAASVAKLGYLYTSETAFGVEAITPDNYNTFEGTRGICPEGWHIPTRADFISAFGYALKKSSDEPTVINDKAPFYVEGYEGGSVVKANEAGFNFTFSGAIVSGKYNALVIDETVCEVADFYGENRMNYIVGSTPYTLTTNDDGSINKCQFFYGMTTFATPTYLSGRLTAAYASYNFAGQIRCVKNK